MGEVQTLLYLTSTAPLSLRHVYSLISNCYTFQNIPALYLYQDNPDGTILIYLILEKLSPEPQILQSTPDFMGLLGLFMTNKVFNEWCASSQKNYKQLHSCLQKMASIARAGNWIFFGHSFEAWLSMVPHGSARIFLQWILSLPQGPSWLWFQLQLSRRIALEQ